MNARIVHTENAPAAIGPYSQAVVAGNLLFTAGQIALDPTTGQIVQGDVAAQTERVMRNLRRVLVRRREDDRVPSGHGGLPAGERSVRSRDG